MALLGVSILQAMMLRRASFALRAVIMLRSGLRSLRQHGRPLGSAGSAAGPRG